MVESFGSFHVIGEDRKKIQELMTNITEDFVITKMLTHEEKEYHDAVLLQLGNNFMTEYKDYVLNNIWQKIPLVGVACDYGYSFFGSAINIDTLQTIINLIFDYEEAPTVLGVAVKDARFIRLCVYKKSRVQGDWLVDMKGNFEGEVYYRPRWKNMFVFEELFGIKKNDFKIATKEKSVKDALNHIRGFIGFPIHLSCEDVMRNYGECEIDYFFNKISDVPNH